MTELQPDYKHLNKFVGAMFKHADPGGFVSLRAFYDDKSKPFHITAVPVGDGLDLVADYAAGIAYKAANAKRPVVFCPPIATFSNSEHAREQDLLQGLALSVECDQHPSAAREKLEQLLGPATVVVRSGGKWTNGSGVAEDKLHLHWRWAKPPTGDDLPKAKHARDLAARIVGGDPSNKPTCHPIRWPGSWHRKQEPRLCGIVVLNAEREIDLDSVLKVLTAAAPAVEVSSKAKGKASSKAPSSKKRGHVRLPGEERRNDDDDGERVDWSETVGRIIAGEGLHDNLRDLGASLLGSGVTPGAAKGVLRAVMNSSTARGSARWRERYDDIGRAVESAQEKFDAVGELFDPWAQYVVPAFPPDVLPPVAQDFVTAQSTVIGCDPSALAMAVLATFSGALDHRLELKMMRHGAWYERPRLWVLLVGDPSAKKTPIFDNATAPLERYQNVLQQDYQRELRAYERAKSNGADVAKPIPPARYVVWDTTTEKLGELLARYDKGLLVKRDEIAGWVGSMEKYTSGRGAGADRAFWLKAYDGGGYAYDRISRGELFIKNLSVSLLGGIQPKRLAELRGLTSDGLLQRFLPVLMRPATLTLDRASNDEAYRGLVRALIRVQPARLGMTDAALEVMEGLRKHLHELALASGGLADGFQSFVGKLAGYSGSLAVVLHMASDPRGGAASLVERATVENVRRLVVGFILPHAFEFYRAGEGMTDGDRLQRLASFVLTSGLQQVKTRDLTRGVASLRGLTLWELNQQVSTLVAAGWLKPVGTGPLYGAWWVNPAVAAQFAERREAEEMRKQRVAELMGSPRKMRPEG